jgi:hypothetical protein
MTIALLAGCRAPARTTAGVPANPEPVTTAPLIGLDGSTLTGTGAPLIGLDGSTISTQSTPKKETPRTVSVPSAAPSAVPCSVVEALDGATVRQPFGQVFDLSVKAAKGSSVRWAATAGEVMGSSGEAAWQPPTSGTDATITATIKTEAGVATLTWVAARGKTDQTLVGPVVTACNEAP